MREVALVMSAIGALMAVLVTPAFAGSADLGMDDQNGSYFDCPVAFDNSQAPPSSPIEVSDMSPRWTCDVDILGSGEIEISGATASFTGTIRIEPGGLLFPCSYSGSLSGGAAATHLAGAMATPSFWCPSPVHATLGNIAY